MDIDEIYEEEILRQVEEGEELLVPEVFKQNGEKILLKTSVDNVILTPSSLFGQATMDRLMSLEYRGYRIFLVETTEVNFLILYDNKTHKYYLVTLGSRANSKNLFTSLNKFLEKIGLFAVPSKLDPKMIDFVREDLRGQLIDTTLDRFPTPKIKMKRIIGHGYQDEPSYLQDASVGSVHQHMFEFIEREDTPPNVVTLSEDGLVRFYNAITYKKYEWFLRDRIFPCLRQIKKLPSAPLTGYITLDDIFEQEEKGED